MRVSPAVTPYIRKMRRSLFMFLLAAATSLQAQHSGKFSPKFLAPGSVRYGDHHGEFTIQVSDLPLFKITYPDLEILYFHAPSGSLRIAANVNLVRNAFAEDKNVLFIDIPGKPVEESYLDDPNFAFNRIRKAQSRFPEIDGAALIISVKERTVDSSDLDLTGRVIYTGPLSGFISEHATDMATIIAGRGNSSPFNRGAVPSAVITPSDFENLLPDNEQFLVSSSIHLQNHSYGVGIENYYGIEAAAYDAAVYAEPTVLHVFSAGNLGTSLPDQGPYAGMAFANLTGNFKQAKNVLVVSAVDTSFSVSALNSRGPAFDGRLKPELTAYGGRGTSDAAAIASGVAAILQDAYLDSLGIFPQVSLIRAMLIAGATDSGPEGIDFFTGYGSIRADNSLDILKKGWYAAVQVNRSTTASLIWETPPGVSRLRLAVCWTDTAASVNSAVALMNDIDAVLQHNGNSWLPWVLDSDPEHLTEPPTRRVDHLNNVEYFTIDQPEAGTYQLQLSGDRLVTPHQKVHIAWSYEWADTLGWDYPSSSDQLRSGQMETIFWSETLPESTGNLSFTLDGSNWESLGEVVLGKGQYAWEVPDTSVQAQLRIQTASGIFTSDTFHISRPPDLTVNFNCDKRFGLIWKSIPGALSYQVWQLTAPELAELTVTTDTAVSIDKVASSFYAVSPVFEDWNGLRSNAINYAFQGAFCYINFFAAAFDTDNRLQLTLNLSTSINIERIEIRKSFNTIEGMLLSSFSPSGETEFILIDPAPDPGLISYQAILYFEDGTSLQSEVSELYVENTGKAILFPNPTGPDDPYLFILSSGTGQRLQILDRGGKLLIEKVLLSKVDDIPVLQLESGLYLYRLLDNEKLIDSGKFIVY